MTQCNLHFKDDPTAHATVEWFLSHLSPGDTGSKTKVSYSDFAKEFISSLSEDNSSLSESLFKGLTAARFIDCLRQQVMNRGLLESIEHIAEELKNTGNWEAFPNLCVLLLSVARESFLKGEFPDDKQSVKDTSLYWVVKQIYKGFLKKKDVLLALEAGIQLSKFQINDFQIDKWQREFTEVKTLHYKELDALRQYYYSVDNSTAFSERVVERWRWLRLNKENSDDIEVLKKLDEEFCDLNPLRLGLPIRNPGAATLKFVERFARVFQDLENEKLEVKKEVSEKEVEELGKEYRIFQWEILVRNLVEEFRGKELHVEPITSRKHISGIPNPKFLSKFISEAQSVECSFVHRYGQMPDKRSNNLSIEASFLGSIGKKVENSQNSFKTLLPKVPDYHPSVHEDIVRAFVNRSQELKKSENSMLIEDGELSFFSLLWLLRHAVGKGEQVKEWGSNPESKRTVCFRFRGDPPKPQWSQLDMYKFAEECGLIIPLSEKEECLPTRRWKSLIAWLRRLNHPDSLENPPVNDKKCLQASKLDKRLPVKALDYKEEKHFVINLWKFFKSRSLEQNSLSLRKVLEELDGLSPDVSLDSSIPRETFASVLGRLVKACSEFEYKDSTYSLLKVGASIGLKDRVLLRCCRAGFLPVEHLFRAYHPYELHLLIQALNWEDSFLEGLDRAPVSLGFATIAGQVETEQDSTADSESSQDAATDFECWLVPYRSLFSDLSANFTLPDVKKSSTQIGIQAGKKSQKQYFAHQTSRLLNAVWADKNRNRLNFESNFSLWMAKTHVTDIWGGFSIDTEQKIYEDGEFNSFSKNIGVDWRALDETQIVRELVYLGLHGGIDRSLDSTDSVIDYVYEHIWTELGASRDEPEKVKKILDKVLESLSFRLPESAPPEWVNTKAFSLCFYHGVRQAAYHALKTFVMTDNNKANPKNPCLLIKWTNQRVWIYNRGEVDPKIHLDPDFEATDREFFKLFDENTNEQFKTEGPKPVEIDDDIWQDDIIWQLMIRKEKS